MLFEELELPYLKQKDGISWKRPKSVSTISARKASCPTSIRSGRFSRICGAMQRAANPGIHGISPDDLRYKTWEEIIKPQSNAVIIAMMDTSGSMGAFEKYVARSFFFWMTRFLRHQYEQVEIVFIAHHTEAKEVTEEEFFTPRRKRRHDLFLRLHESDRDHRQPLPADDVQHLSVSLLGRRQSDIATTSAA